MADTTYQISELPADWAPGAALPTHIDIGGSIGRVEVMQPSRRYAKGTTVAVMFGPTRTPPDQSEAVRRARILGEPWLVAGLPQIIGARLAKSGLGADAIVRLTGGDWSGVIPFLVPTAMVPAGLGMGATIGVGADATGAVSSVAGSASALVAASGVLVAALPWVIGVIAVGVGGLLLYRMAKT